MLPMVGCYLFLSLGMPATIEMNSLSFHSEEVLLIPGAQTWVLQPAVPFFLAGIRFSFLPYYRGHWSATPQRNAASGQRFSSLLFSQ
jgi:hypothetical protein